MALNNNNNKDTDYDVHGVNEKGVLILDGLYFIELQILWIIKGVLSCQNIKFHCISFAHDF